MKSVLASFKIIAPNKVVLLAISLCGSLLLINGTLQAKTHAAYEGGNLIDNSVFLNASTMTKDDIQNFLVNKGAGLANIRFTLTCETAGAQAMQGYLAAGAPCGQPNVLASHIIYYSSQVYGVNPQVILATMQKEQSLTTAANPTSWQLSQAMGYGCPTSGSCSDSSNFFYQIDNGTWVLRFHYERARSNMSWWYTSSSWSCGTGKPSYYMPNLYPNQNVNFIDPYSGLQYATHYIQNAATSAFYCYTPHTFNNHTNSPHPNELKDTSRCYPSLPAAGSQGRCYTGSYNFVRFFELWFGSTQRSSLVKGPSSPTYYLLTNGKKYAIPSGDILYAYGIEDMPLYGVSDLFLNSIEDGGMLTTIFTVPGDGTVYLADGGKKYGIASGEYCTRWGLACGNTDIQKEVGLEISDIMGNGGVLQPIMKFQDRYFLMESGKKREFLSVESLQEKGYSTGSSTIVINWTNAIREFGTSLPQNNTFVKFAASSAIYLYSNSSFYALPNYDTFLGWFGPNGISHLDRYSTYNVTPPATAGTVNQLVNDAGNIFALGYDKKFLLVGATAPLSATNLDDLPQLASLVTSKPTQTIDSTTALAFPGGAISSLINNTLRPIPSLTDLFLSYAPNKIINVPAIASNAYESGKLNIISGRIVKPDNSAAMYMYGSDGYLWGLGNLGELNAALRWNGNIINAPFSIIDSSGIKIYTATVKIGTSYYAVQGDGTIRQLPDNILTTDKNVHAMPLTNPVVSRIATDSKALGFIRFDNGTIFKIEGNAIRPIGSVGTYSALGGNADNTTQVSVKAVSMFNIGSVIP